jgi:signal transduction histidine kinase/CheY-like chemotaxis protein
MGTAPISAKDARRTRVVTLVSWIVVVVATGGGAGAFLNSNPTLKVYVVTVPIYISIALLGRRAPLLAGVALLVCTYSQLYIVATMTGIGGGTPLFYWALAGLAFALLGTERILLVALFGILAVVLVLVLEVRVPYSTGALSSAKLFWAALVPSSIATLFALMATVHYALRSAERAEEALARDNEIIQDKTRLLEDKTRQLEIANKHKAHLIASASHDLRQPLHALNLFVARLRDEPDLAERSRLVARIDASVGSMNELFESLLDMTKLDAGIVEPAQIALPLQGLLDRVETTFSETAHKKGLSLRVVPSAAWVASDPILLERVLLNLISNAVRYTERGGVVVGCRRRGETLRIDICDTGPGIPEDQRSSIFGEFYQLVRSGAGRREGLGLGLAIVDRLCRLLGHRVELRSQLGRGSRFSVTVPLAAEPDAETEMPAPQSPMADPAHGKRVLVIDDDILVLDAMRGILQGWGCEVETAASGAVALARLEGNVAPPDVIISDSRLADGRSGIDAIAGVRATVGAPIPALIITGDTAPERLREASAAGFPLLHKPVSPMALRTTLNRLLKASAPSPHSDAP